MVKKTKNKYLVTYGGWYQRTTIHLTEIYDFLFSCKTYLDLSKQKLKKYRSRLDIKSVKRKAAYLEYVEMKTNSGITVKYFEDGLYVFEKTAPDIKKAREELVQYHEKYFQPAVRYLFSLGAPIPKVLANIKTIHPTVVSVKHNNHKNFDIEKSKFGEVYSKISADNMTVYKTPEYIFIVANDKKYKVVDKIVQMQVFFREFKDQLEKYLEIHRLVWEEIENIKKQKSIRGKDVEKVRFKLDSYEKTVTLITHRINQMGVYVDTRTSISKHVEIQKYLILLFSYKFETLVNTFEYIQEIWGMTKAHLDSAIKLVVEIQEKTTDASIKSLRLVTAIGVISGLSRYIFKEEFPKLTLSGFLFFVTLVVISWLLDMLIVKIYQQIKYKLKVKDKWVRF